jgi:hypothetical protein
LSLVFDFFTFLPTAGNINQKKQLRHAVCQGSPVKKDYNLGKRERPGQGFDTLGKPNGDRILQKERVS